MHVTHIHIKEGRAEGLQSTFKLLIVVLIVKTFQTHMEILLCGDQSDLSLCVCWFGFFSHLLELVQQILHSQYQLLEGRSLICFLNTKQREESIYYILYVYYNLYWGPKHNPRITYIKPTACHNAVDLFIGQLGAVEAQPTGHLIHYFCVVKAFIRKSSQSVHLPHKNPWMWRATVMGETRMWRHLNTEYT